MLPAESIYACRDIREIPWEKVVAYARALQHWAEENNPPAGGGPRLLAESVMELREEVKWYLSFTDEEVFWGWPSLRRKKMRVQRPFLPTSLRHPVCRGQPRKGDA